MPTRPHAPAIFFLVVATPHIAAAGHRLLPQRHTPRFFHATRAQDDHRTIAQSTHLTAARTHALAAPDARTHTHAWRNTSTAACTHTLPHSTPTRAHMHVAPHVVDHARTRVQMAGDLPSSSPPVTHAVDRHQPRLGWTGSDANCWRSALAQQ